GSVYQAGTLSGNPLAMHMGYQTLEKLKGNDKLYQDLEEKAQYLEKGLNDIIAQYNIEATVNRAGGMLSLFFAKGPVENYDQVMKSDTEKFAIYYREMLSQGILLAPSQ